MATVLISGRRGYKQFLLSAFLHLFLNTFILYPVNTHEDYEEMLGIKDEASKHTDFL
jgi:hypothetical protein